MSKPRRIRITHIHKQDAYYRDVERYIGLEGEFIPDSTSWYKGYYTGKFYPDGQKREGYMYFIGVRYRRI